VTRQTILLVGAGGHAMSCIDVLEAEGRFQIGGLVTSSTDRERLVSGYPVIGTDSDLEDLRDRFRFALVVIGQIKTSEPRVRSYEQLRTLDYETPSFVSPRAYVSRSAKLGPGSIVMHGAIVNAGASVGANCIINSRALVEHGAAVDDHCHVATGAIINGDVRIGEQTFIGSGALVREGVTVGKGCVIGMGRRVLSDCAPGMRLTGREAR
jgi:sugar O-acyltransferase (sialic acid O-acetyltransferase NeuD family)